MILVGAVHRTYTRVIVTCTCGTLPLNDHANARDAWAFAAAHVALTARNGEAICVPDMHRDQVLIPVSRSI